MTMIRQFINRVFVHVVSKLLYGAFFTKVLKGKKKNLGAKFVCYPSQEI